MMKHTIPMIQYAHAHVAYSASRDEKVAPRIYPPGAQAPKRLKIMFFRIPLGYVVPSKANPLGVKNAGPIPWKPRATVKKMLLE